MKIQKRLFALCLCIICLALETKAVTYPWDFSADGIYYQITGENTVSVTYYKYVSTYDDDYYYTPYSGDVNIPAQVDFEGTTYKITGIGKYAFFADVEKSKVTSVTLPTTITSIGYGAFMDCTELPEIKLPQGLTTIESNAFYYCSSLKEIIIPDKVKEIGANAFYGCSNITSINIPNSVTSVGSAAFASCSKLTDISFSKNMNTLSYSMFSGCISLTDLIIPEHISNIQSSAFTFCHSLRNITCLSPVPPTTSASAFSEGTYDTASLNVPKGSEDFYQISEGWNKFRKTYRDSIIVGNNTGATSILPFGNNAQYSTTQCLYTPEEIGGAGTITSLAYYVSSSQKLSRTVRIYMGHKSSLFANASDAVQLEDLQQVYFLGSAKGETCGWETINLDTPFAYNGVDNLVIVVCGMALGSQTETLQYGCTYMPSNSYTLYRESNTDSGYYSLPFGSPGFATSRNRPDIKLSKTIEYIPTIGTGGSNSFEVPYCSNYKYSTTQNLYTAEEIGSAGSIRSIAFKCTMGQTYPYETPLVSVYMGHKKGTFDSSADKLKNSDVVPVYYGRINVGNKTGWETINLNTAFNYNGKDNLVVIICKWSGNMGSANYTYTEGAQNTLVRKHESYSWYGNLEDNAYYDVSNKRANIRLTMMPFEPVQSVVLDKTSINIFKGDTIDINAMVTPSDATNYTVSWKSSDESVAIVTSDGKVIGLGDGKAIITATSNDGTNISASCDVTVAYKSKLYINNTRAVPGSQPSIPVYMDNSKEICNLQFDVVLPEGMSIYYGMNEDEEEAYWVTKGERCKEAHSIAVSKNANNTYRVVISSTSNAVLKDIDKSLPIACIKLDISDKLTKGPYDIKIEDIKLSHDDNGTTTIINVDNTKATVDVAQYYTVADISGGISYGMVTISGDEYDAETQLAKEHSTVVLTAIPNEGYEFGGWVGENISGSNNPWKIEDLTRDIVFVATFVPKEYKVTFVADGKTVSESMLNYGTAITAPNAPEKEGYTFKSWGEVASTVTAQDVTYTAIYEINKYQVRFIANGEDVYNKEQEYGSAITAPNAPEKDGYAFITWGEVAENVPAHDVEYTAEYVMVGDLVDDGKLNIGDLTKLVGVILRNEGESLDVRNFKKADVLVDNTIDIGDYTRLVGKILDADAVKAKGAYTAYCNPALYAEKNGNAEVLLSLKDASNVTAIQFDMNVTEGTSVVLNGMPQHNIVTNMLDENTMRVLVYSANNTAFADNGRVSVKVENATDELEVKNIVCGSSQSKAVLADMTISLSNTTAADAIRSTGNGVATINGGLSIASDKDQQVRIYTIAGKLVEVIDIHAGETKTVSLASGSYIVGGQKYNVK